MNAKQKTAVLEKVKKLAEENRSAAHEAWLALRANGSGKTGAASVSPKLLGDGDGVFWSWSPKTDEIYIKSPVKVLNALEAVAALGEAS